MKLVFIKMRRKLIYFALFCTLFIWRWGSTGNLLPETWTAESKVRYTARILEQPELTDSKTIIRSGRWIIKLKGYQALSVGAEYEFVGRAEPRVILGKQAGIVMIDPIFEIIESDRMGVGERVVMGLSTWRERMVDNLAKWLPEPHSSLSAGILLGVKRQMPWEFYQQLVATGTLHVVAASGYNVMIVARVVMGVLLMILSKKWAIVAGVGAIAAYVVIAGGGAAVVRAGIMGSLTLAAYYWGRPAEAKRLLWVTAGAMLLVQPLMLVDVGFQLSVAATAGLLYLEPVVRGWTDRRVDGWANTWIRPYINEYWWPTVAATMATMPIIWLTFGRVSWISPLVNIFILPLVPLIMFLSALAVGVGALIPVLGQLVSYLLYVPLWWVVEVIRTFG